MDTIYHHLAFPLLRRLDPERAHDLTISALRLAQSNGIGCWLLRRIAGPLRRRPLRLFGLTFPNVLGLAAGFDKDAHAVGALALLGFGHIEVGTITPYPQPGNPRPRIFRLPADQALINRMGFPSQGLANVVPRLRQLARRRSFILGVSLGKQKTTPLADAVDDYLVAMRAVYPYADYLAVNISSPNTPGLRQLQGKQHIAGLLSRLNEERAALSDTHRLPPRPLLVKIAPDLSRAELDDMLQVMLDQGVDGVIATNTTTSRAGLTHPAQCESGGLSGAPLRQRSTALVAAIHQAAGRRLPIIAAGGVAGAAHAREKL
ncbi:MAG TPA: quinone-dependent dihydroorotate dehydrogenase, partial [Candidatus Sulfomarinibacteraceae bacterium]|nr:quinone-dependent dihydroorotate dehydrogenase [Candidatus Sulfomarinibacteraceae bacterium]